MRIGVNVARCHRHDRPRAGGGGCDSPAGQGAGGVGEQGGTHSGARRHAAAQCEDRTRCPTSDVNRGLGGLGVPSLNSL